MGTGWLENNAIPENQELTFGSFWPGISTSEFYIEYRPPSELPESLVKSQLVLAGIRVSKALAAWKNERPESSLADLPQESVNGEGELIHLFKRAVFCEAKAEILRETLTATRRKEAENSAKTAVETEDKYHELATNAIALITGQDAIQVTVI